MKRRIFSLITASVFMVVTFCGQAFAVTMDDDVLDEDNIQLIAEMSLDTATLEMQEKILEARKEIIFSQSWSVDGVGLYVERQDGTIEKVPEFSELFPEWDVPVMDSSLSAEGDSEVIADGDSEIMPLSAGLSFRVYLRNPAPGVDTSPFTHFTHNGTYVKTRVDTLYASEHCNIGFSDYNTGASFGYLNEVYPTETARMDTFGWGEFECAVRASTNSTPGYGNLVVSHDIPVSAR